VGFEPTVDLKADSNRRKARGLGARRTTAPPPRRAHEPTQRPTRQDPAHPPATHHKPPIRTRSARPALIEATMHASKHATVAHHFSAEPGDLTGSAQQPRRRAGTAFQRRRRAEPGPLETRESRQTTAGSSTWPKRRCAEALDRPARHAPFRGGASISPQLVPSMSSTAWLRSRSSCAGVTRALMSRVIALRRDHSPRPVPASD